MRCAITRTNKIASFFERVLPVYVLFLWAILGLASCAPTQGRVATPTSISPVSTPTRPLPPSDWQLRWLRGIPCRAPCWEGVTPGQSSASEAIALLNHSPIVINAQRKVVALMPELGRVTWNWVDGQEGGYANYPAKTSTEIIYSIAPLFRKTFRLTDVLETYGTPSHIIATAQPAPDRYSPTITKIFYDSWFIYLPQGLVVRSGGPDKPDLSQDTLFDQVVFFVPTQEGLEKSISIAREHSEWILPWQGFRNFEFYCRDVDGGRLCREK